jgi:hypothetical protein
MTLSYDVTGSERKRLVSAISQTLNTPTKYLGAPTFTYEVGGYRISQDGTVTGADNLDLEDALHQQGFDAVEHTYDEADTYESGLSGMGAAPSIAEISDEAELLAERELRRMRLDAENIHDHSNRGPYGGDDIPDNREDGMTKEEELGLGRSRREDFHGENGMRADDVPEYYTYRAELSDPDWPDRMEVFTATSNADAIRQAWDFCMGDVILLELFLLNDDYDVVRSVEITPARLTVEMPSAGFTPEKFDNLRKLVAAKASLIKAAIGADDLPIEQNEDTLSFPWFRFTDDSATVKAYSALVSLLCKTAIEKKRVTAKENSIDGSPKYAMRCFLLSLGFIGAEYKAERKILFSKLNGSSSYSKNPLSGGSDDE